jgi:hypothetical protein
MKNIKKLGIWMDHSIAYVMELKDDAIVENIVALETFQPDNESEWGKNERLVQKKEQQLQTNYYKKLSEIIRSYEEVVLFGPTEAKNELSNLLKADHLFDNIKFNVKLSDKMSAKQMHIFVKEYFK